MKTEVLMIGLTIGTIINNLTTKDKINKYEIFAWQLCTLMWVYISMKGGL